MDADDNLKIKTYSELGIDGVLFVINDPEGHRMFYEFCRSEFSIENLLFFDEARAFQQKFHEMTSNDQIVAAWHIYNKYISAEAELPLNLSSEICAVIKSRLEESPDVIEDTIFTPAMKSALMLMSHDTFLRFKFSKEFKAFREKFRRISEANAVLSSL